MIGEVQMRTRFLSKMTNGEVEEYLNRNDIIYVPVGVTETHGALPLDSETVLAEAIAKRHCRRSLKHFVKWMFIRRIVFFLNTGRICQAEELK
jgi:creatinine amidohydrolase/Fe(II)-dependent formamide hydrolase-like protein